MKKMIILTIVLPAAFLFIATAIAYFDSHSSHTFLDDTASTVILGIISMVVYYFILMTILYFTPIGLPKKILISVFAPLVVLGLMVINDRIHPPSGFIKTPYSLLWILPGIGVDRVFSDLQYQPQPLTKNNMENNQTNADYYMPSAERWQKVSAQYAGKNISYEIVIFDPKLNFSQISEAEMNSDSPTQASALYYHLLSLGKIQEAADQVSANPETTIQQWSIAGSDYVKKMATDYFSKSFMGAFVKVNGTYLLLVGNGEKYPIFQAFENTGGKYKLKDEGLSEEVRMVESYLADLYGKNSK